MNVTTITESARSDDEEDEKCYPVWNEVMNSWSEVKFALNFQWQWKYQVKLQKQNSLFQFRFIRQSLIRWTPLSKYFWITFEQTFNDFYSNLRENLNQTLCKLKRKSCRNYSKKKNH